MNLRGNKRPKGLFVVLWAAGSLLWGSSFVAAQVRPPGGGGRPPSSGPRVLTLQQAVRIALKNNAEIQERKAGVLGALGKRAQADAGRYPQFEATVLLGPSPEAKGDQVSSPQDVDDPKFSDVFTKGIFSLVQPIFTFGEISGLRKAAASNVKVERAKVEEKASEVVLKVNEFYYGYLLARDLRSLVLEVKDELESAKRKVRELLEKESVTVDEISLYKLEAFTSTVESSLNQAEKSVRLALEALKFTMGLRPGEQIEVADAHIVKAVRRLESLPFYQERSLDMRPEFRQIREGLIALRAMVKVEKSHYWPKFFIGAFADIAEAGNRTDLTNPFVTDPLNSETGGVALGLKWSFNFGITAGRVAEARAEVQKVLHKRAFARQGIPLQVRKAYEELLEAHKNIQATENSYTFARKWLVASVANFDLGIGDPEEIFKALERYAKTRAENYKGIFAYNMAVAKLDHASGLVMKTVRGAQ